MIIEDGEHIYEIDDIVTITNSSPLSGNEVGPPVIVGEEYPIKNIVLDDLNKQHLDLGIPSMYNFIRSWNTQEELPNGDVVHWVSPHRVELKEIYDTQKLNQALEVTV